MLLTLDAYMHFNKINKLFIKIKSFKIKVDFFT